MILDDLVPVLITLPRSIGFVIPNVVVEELHRDELVITDHPVERGAMISDHAFKRPAEVEMRCGWSDSGAGPGFVIQVYQSLLALQRLREPFTVSTGKRLYPNMLIRGLGTTTDEKTEHALMVVCALREVIIVNTQATGAPAKDMALPAKTAPEVDAGTKQLQVGANGRVAGPV